MVASTLERILDAAEQRIRVGGYHGFSFREVAKDVGIKSASVHYHFPAKEDLGRRVAARYRERTLDALGESSGLSPERAFRGVAAVFLAANEVDDRMCLCGVLGSEADGLPEGVRSEVEAYFEQLAAWLARALGPSALSAPTLVASLEGALLLARTRRDPQLLRDAVEELAAALR